MRSFQLKGLYDLIERYVLRGALIFGIGIPILLLACGLLWLGHEPRSGTAHGLVNLAILCICCGGLVGVVLGTILSLIVFLVVRFRARRF